MAGSIYKQCADAAREILFDLDLTSSEHPGLFTDLDVIALASQNAGGYDDEAFKDALREANNILGRLYKAGDAARFGPVRAPGIPPDYARIATKIVYTHPEQGPRQMETPNGTFKRLMSHQDKIHRPGRALGTNRDDLVLWSEQDFVTQRPLPKLRRVPTPRPQLEARIDELEARLENALERLEALENTEQRRRQMYASA